MSVSGRIASVLAVVFLGSVTLVHAKPAGELAGRVTDAVVAMPTVTIYAYELADLQMSKTVTRRDGSFLFKELPAGLYKVIAFKAGFVPSVMVLRRATAQARQFLELQLHKDLPGNDEAELSFWDVREQIPTDVLRDMELGAFDSLASATAAGPATQFDTEMRAIAGVNETLDFASATVAGAEVGVNGKINDFKIDFDGRFSELKSGDYLTDIGDPATGSSQELSFKLENAGRSRLAVASHNNSLRAQNNGDTSEVDFERHRVSWSQELGKSGRSNFSAQYTAENNFYGKGLLEPMGIPSASRTLRLEGSYRGSLTDRTTLEAGVRYRDRTSDYLSVLEASNSLVPDESVEVFGRGGLALKPAMMVEYGLYSTLHDGTLSFSPQGGLVFEFGPSWSAATSFSRRLDQGAENERRQDFVSSYVGNRDACRQAELYCYEVLMSRLLGNSDKISFGAVHRKIGETQRLYFSEDFFNRRDSLYLVEGDRLPELKVELTRRLSPQVSTRLESNLAAGGGGVFYSGGEKPYENSVRYLVTSLDTRFEETKTGVFLAFHHLEQELEPLGLMTLESAQSTSPEALELQRLQLMLSQDLAVLHDLASDWAVHLNMELSRGGVGTPGLVANDDLRKRVTGGLAVKF